MWINLMVRCWIVVSLMIFCGENGTFAQRGHESELKSDTPGAIAEVSHVEGEVTVTRMDGSVETAKEGMPLFRNDIVETGEGANVGFVLSDGLGIVSLVGRGRMILDEFVFTTDDQFSIKHRKALSKMFYFLSESISGNSAVMNDVTQRVETPL